VPLHLANAAPDQNPEPSGRDTQVRKLEGRVLIAEDNAINTLVLQTILEKAGLTVDTAYNGREALDSLARERYDAVFMDISMPEMDGVEATRQIRSGEWSGVSADIPVIAITAHAMQGDREAFLEQGMTAYIGKPFTRDGVLKVLEPILSGDHA
jgi:CheY-like chemotaxis protein